MVRSACPPDPCLGRCADLGLPYVFMSVRVYPRCITILCFLYTISVPAAANQETSALLCPKKVCPSVHTRTMIEHACTHKQMRRNSHGPRSTAHSPQSTPHSRRYLPQSYLQVRCGGLQCRIGLKNVSTSVLRRSPLYFLPRSL